VDKYIARLQTAVERLSRENNKLASYHAQIIDKVIYLVTSSSNDHDAKAEMKGAFEV
jgi:hypothetical protein